MKTAFALTVLASTFSEPATALGLEVRAQLDRPMLFAQARCAGAARREAVRTGGRVLAARPDGRGGCEVTLLVPQRGGRPRRVVVNVPA